MLTEIHQTIEFIRTKTAMIPEIGIILGSGLGGFSTQIEVECEIPYHDIPNFPISTVAGHQGKLVFGKFAGRNLVALQGRFHFYEGYSLKQVTFPIRVMKYLGVKFLILSNASGGLNPDFEIGDVMIIRDHINLMHDNPLLGPNIEEFGPRFLDMSEAYNKPMIVKAHEIAGELGISVKEGVYAGVSGPTYETPAEYHYIRMIGADAVGMSTVPEVIVARHMGMKCFALSIITDLGVHGKIVEISHDEVIDAAAMAEPKMSALVKRLVETAEIN